MRPSRPCEAREDGRQRVEGVGHGAAEGAGVEVRLGAVHDQLEVGQTFEAVGDRGHAGGELAGVGDDRVIAAELRRVRRDVGFQVRAADLFLAFDQELDVHRQAAAGLEPGFGGLEVGEHLPLVVGRAAGVEVAVADGRLERGGEPGLERLGGLNVVMAVDEDGGLAGDVAALRRRRAGGPWSRSTRRARPIAARSSRTNSAARRVSASWSGWALTLGMRINALSCSSKSSRCASRYASTRSIASTVDSAPLLGSRAAADGRPKSVSITARPRLGAMPGKIAVATPVGRY